jgi:ribosomal protein S18 acetylase RimI-like enzyme
MTVTLRPMRPADLDQVLAIAEQSPEAPHWKPSDYTPYFAPDLNPSLLRTAVVALAPNPHQPAEIQAFAAATLLNDGQQNLSQLDSIAVHPAARRQGVATALLRAILTWSARNNACHPRPRSPRRQRRCPRPLPTMRPPPRRSASPLLH